MMQTGIMRLSEGGLLEGGTPAGMTPQMAADFVSWFINKFGRGALGPQSWQAAKALWLKESGHATYGDSLKEYYPEASWDTYVNWVTSGQWDDTDTGDTDTDKPQTVFPAGSDVPSIEGYEEGSIITVGDVKYILTNNLWKVSEGETEPTTVFEAGSDLPSPIDYEEGSIITVGDVKYILTNSLWKMSEGETPGSNQGDGDGDGAGGLLGLGIGPWLKSTFGLDDTAVGNLLSGLFGAGSLSKLIDLVAAKNAYEEGYKYEVPTGQMASQSEIGKQWGLPSREGMVMQGMGPNYLQDQQYAMPKGTTMPAATHISGNPLLKQIEGGKQGGIMGLKSHGDITPAFLEPGEFVFTKKATDNMGAKRLYKLMQQAEQMGMN